MIEIMPWDVSLLRFCRAHSQQIRFDHLICVVRPILQLANGFPFWNFSNEHTFLSHASNASASLHVLLSLPL